MRKSFSSLCGIVRQEMNLDPLSGYLFVFKNSRGNKIKLLYWDRDGFVIWYKALQKGTFRFPSLQNLSSAGLEIDSSTLRMVLDGICLRTAKKRPRYNIDLADIDLLEAYLGDQYESNTAFQEPL